MQLFTLIDNFVSNPSLAYIRLLTVFFLIPEILFLLTHRNSVIKHWRIFPAVSIVAVIVGISWDYFGIKDGAWFFPGIVGIWIFGIPNATLWGSIAAIAALIPSVGTSLVVLPGVLYLFLFGERFAALGLMIWGMTAVGLIDNILGPHLMKRGIAIHPFFILLSVLGGLGLFGPVGFLIGPLILALLFALLDIYAKVIKPLQ